MRSLRRVFSWHRRKFAVLAAVVAVLAGVNAATPRPDPTVDVVVAAHPLIAGNRLSRGDLTVEHWPASLVPDQAVAQLDGLVGRTMVAGATLGTPLTTASVLTSDSAHAPPGSVITAVRLADATVVSMLAPGDRIDLIAVAADGRGHAHLVADGARLVTVPAASTAHGPLTTAGPDSGSIVVVEVPTRVALALADASAVGPLTAVVH